MIRIAIVDDNTFLQKAIIDKLSFFEDIAVRFKAINGTDLMVKLEKNHNIDLILMDIEMPKMNGIEATEFVKNTYPQIKIIMLTVMDNEEHIFNAIKAGAEGYLLKEVSPEDLYKAIVDTLNGGAAMSPLIAMKTLKLFRETSPVQTVSNEENYNLTPREIEVLEQLSKGLRYKDIAENLFLSKGTIKKHINNIYAKLHVKNKLIAIKIAKNNKLI